MEKKEIEIIDANILIAAYSNGFFPMADSVTGAIHWYSPDPRAIIPIYSVKPPHSMRQLLKKGVFEIRKDNNFEQVIMQCAKRPETWINDTIVNSYINLYRLGYAHSVETYQDGSLVGGLYGVTIGAAFFGESMFSVVSNASKVAFYHLVEHLKDRGFVLLDSQFINPHTKLLGAIEISRSQYLKILKIALEKKEVNF
jgi:leucyl/phenylalanyl-tRNA--protein transferase